MSRQTAEYPLLLCEAYAGIAMGLVTQTFDEDFRTVDETV